MKLHAPIPGLAQAVRDKRAFTALLRREFAIDWNGYHGAAHWARVALNGRLLCRASDANPRVVDLFALLHDLRRENEGSDSHHGPRAADFIREIADEHLLLNREELDQLCKACVGHSGGETTKHPTIAACWDADRLDLGRVGTRPHARFLSLEAARDPRLMAWAWRQSTARLGHRGRAGRQQDALGYPSLASLRGPGRSPDLDREIQTAGALPARPQAIPMKFSRITIDPAQMAGVPCIRGLRIPVATVVGMLADGMTPDQILEAYPDLEAEDIREALRYAAEVVRERVVPVHGAG